MQRRDFLKLLGLTPFAAVATNLALAATGGAAYRNLLVLIELKGGNDGLNTVVPYADARYRQLRPRLAVAREKALVLDEHTGLHPALAALLPLWRGRELAVVQGVGYPQPNLSHFRSIEIWDTASNSNQYRADGWLARAFAADPPPASFAADGVIVASHDQGPLAGGKARVIALANTEQFVRQAQRVEAPTASSTSPALMHILKVERDIQRAANGLDAGHAFRTEFPRHPFGNAVKTASQVVAGNAGVAVVKISHNGFDTHGNQAGTHARLLTQLAEGVMALKAALTEVGRWDSTLVMSYAEFGRRPRENQSAGTDHGTASAHFVLGGRVRGGLYGQRPPLDRLDGQGNLPHAVDFRSLYATVIEKWWGQSSAAVLGGTFATLDVIRS